jgi:hypothetical protein
MRQKEIVFFSAIIRGEGREVPCNIRVTKTSMEGAPIAFSDHAVVSSDETDGLPDGSYVVHLQSGEEIPIAKKNGFFKSL